MKRLSFLLGLIGISIPLFSQSLFESSFSSDNTDEKTFEINGYVRSDVFANETDYRSVYGETSLKLKTTPFKFGEAFTEIRFKQNLFHKKNILDIDFREAYLNLYLKNFDFRIGQQIIVWGRADGFNPTNNLTPHNYTVFSPDEDDKRLSNFVVKGTYNYYPFKFSANCVPVYKPSVLPFEKAELPDKVIWSEPNYPVFKIKKSSFAFKLSFEKAALDGSLSYFNGYHKLPGIKFQAIDSRNNFVFLSAHHIQIIGLDFSTYLKSFGFRGEVALSVPSQREKQFESIPNRQFEYTLGLDREWGNFNLIVQYIGKYVSDYEDLTPTDNSALSQFTEQLKVWNRMIYAQQNKWSHAISLRPSVSLLHQTLICEIIGLYNFSTEEHFIKPKATYGLSDNISLSAGAQIYAGPTETLFHILGKGLNAGFIECKVSFQ